MCNGSLQDQLVDVGIVVDIVDESSNTLGSETHRNFGRIREFRIWSCWKSGQYHQEIDIREFFWDSKCEIYDSTNPAWMRSTLLSDRTTKVDESKSNHLLWFSVVLEKDAWFSGSSWTMERPSGNFSDGKIFQWAIGTRWRTIWIRVDNSPRIHSFADSFQNPKRSRRSTHRPGRVQWWNHLHVCVQWHKRRHWRKRHILYFDICENSGIRFLMYGRTLGIPGTRRRTKTVSGVWLQTRRKMGLHCFWHGAKFWKVKTSHIQRDKRLESWDHAEKERQRHHIHHNGESSDVESLYRLIHSANQLSFYRAVRNWWEALGRNESKNRENSGRELNRRLRKEQKINAEEINSLVKIPRTPLVSGNRMRQKFQNASEKQIFELLSARSQLKHIHERAGFFIIQWKGVNIIWLVLMVTMDVDISLQCAENTLIHVNFLNLGVSQRSRRIPKLTSLERTYVTRIGVYSSDQVHAGGITIRPELMNYALIPYNWKEFIFHRGSALNQFSITQTGLVARGKESKEGRQTVFFHVSWSIRKRCTRRWRCEWALFKTKRSPLSKSLETWTKFRTRGKIVTSTRSWLQFWQTKSNAIIVFQSVPNPLHWESCQR